MSVDLGTIRALTFDVGGTVFDWHHGIKAEIAALAEERGSAIDAAAFTNAWRRQMFGRLAMVRTGALPWMNADGLHRIAIDDIAPQFPALELSSEDRDALTAAWHRLDAWPDFAPALPRLRSRYTTTVLTVLSLAIVVDCSKRNGLLWDAITSCEVLGVYKPDRDAYLEGVRLLGIEPHEAMMVACHPGDLAAASAAGLRTAYVERPLENGGSRDLAPFPAATDAATAPPFDFIAPDFPALAEQLGV